SHFVIRNDSRPHFPPMIGAVESQRVVVVLDNIRSLYNTGSIFRTADACGVARVVLCGITPRPDQGGRQRRAIKKTALGAEDAVPWEYRADAATALREQSAGGYHIVAVETSPDAVNLFEWTPSWPVCLVFGHEREGISGDLTSQVETVIRIPMLGQKRSLNVATAAGVVLYELLRRRLYDTR
ncbi:MAG TPA: RNA methyltransferase, partial [Vicinamibacterales bacterium]